MGRLTTHILDTERGRPASGVEIDLIALRAEGPTVVGSAVTNADGRTDAPILEGEAFVPGEYELHFKVGLYLEAGGRSLPQPKFLDTIVVRFGLSSASEHYHVPLLLSANGYSTYRGS
ncbi:hydroxyisourate hydrolase [Hyphomicrobium sp. CS1GBMeth3]|uniref:hydroxyisourate hydrolase n=1 Tax=Hyphomicrobium sp. CS1GBMeth3 TaxID=1892845 RepID=UPI0009319652|nr:hydroxyisourate hydrolase [Hyphomicrobium sp. CS1GBMeth3]